MAELRVQQADQIAWRNMLVPLKNKKSGELAVNKQGFVKLGNNAGMVTNSLLRKDEWEYLERRVLMAQTQELNAIARLQELGLVEDLPNMGILDFQWNVASEMTPAVVNLSGRAQMDQDAQDFTLAGRPIPVISKSFEIGERFLTASRNTGQSIDTSYAAAASKVVAEQLETMFLSGDSSIEMNGRTIYGLTSEPNRNTGSATGDFGTISNIYPTFLAMWGALRSDYHRGPNFEAWVSTNQYTEMANVYTDGSGDSAMSRVLAKIPGLRAVHSADFLTDGSLVMVQMTEDVVKVAINILGTLVEWAAGDGMSRQFRVMTIAAPIVRSDYNSRSGIAHYTGA